MKRTFKLQIPAVRLVVWVALTLLLTLVLFGCAASGAPSSQPDGETMGDTAQSNTAAAPSPAPTAPQTPQPLPADGHFSIPATNVSDGMLLAGGEVLASGGVWVTDQATGRVMGLCEPMRTDRTPHGCRLYGLDGELIWEDARVEVIAGVLGRWAFVRTGVYDYDDGWAVNLDTGEERFRGCELGGEAAPGLFIVDYASGAAVAPDDPPCLVNAQMEILRCFEGYATLGQYNMGMIMPGYLVLYAADNTARLYDIARDEILPGRLDWLIDPQQSLAQLATEEGSAVFRLDTRERIGVWDTSDTPRRYIAYGTDFKLYEQTNLQYRRQEYYAEQEGRTTRVQYAAYTAGGYYLEWQDGSVQLLDASGRLLQTLEPHPNAAVTNNSWSRGGCTLPDLTLRHWQGGYELLGRNDLVLQGRTEGYVGLDRISETRFALYTEFCEQSRFALLDQNGSVLLDGLDQLLPTEIPGIWAVQQGFTVGLMDENGCWLWSRDVSPS